MNILSLLHSIRLDKLDERVTINDIRKGMLGKGHEFRVANNSRFWYRRNKNDLLDLLTNITTSDNKNVKQKMQKFNTDPYFETDDDHKRSLKPEELMNALEYEFSSVSVADEHAGNKSTGLSDQYEKMVLDNGVEIYAVYTPIANIQLAHSILHKQGDPAPTWCIASPSDASSMWNYYNLYQAELPCVFIVYKKGEPKKYEIKAYPDKCLAFKNKKIRLGNFIDELRDPSQTEKDISDTSLFDIMEISIITLENAIRHLMSTKKAEEFSAKYGKEMFNSLTDVHFLSGKERILELTKLAKNGMLSNFFSNVQPNEHEYFLNELKRYNTLTDEYYYYFNETLRDDIFLYLLKNKKIGKNSIDKLRELDLDEFKKVIPQIDPILYATALSYCHDGKKEYIEAVYDAAVINKNFNYNFIKRLYRLQPEFYHKHIKDIIKIILKSNSMTGEIAVDLFYNIHTFSEDEVLKIGEAVLSNRTGLPVFFGGIMRSPYKNLLPYFADKYLKFEKLDIKTVQILPEPWQQKGIEHLISEKKYSWEMLTNEFGISKDIKDYIFKKLIKLNALGMAPLTPYMLTVLSDTKYADKVVDIYIKDGDLITIGDFIELIDTSHGLTENNLIKITNIVDYNGKLYFDDIDYLLAELVERHFSTVYKFIENYLAKNNSMYAKMLASTIVNNEPEDSDLYKLAMKYIKGAEAKRKNNPDAVLNFIDSVATKIVNSLSRSYSQDNLKIFTEIYDRLSAIYDPHLNLVLTPDTILENIKKYRDLLEAWFDIVEDIYERGISIDKSVFEDRCVGIVSKIGLIIRNIYDKVIKNSKIDFLPDDIDPVKAMTSDKVFDFNPYKKCCAKILQELKNKYL